MGFLEVLQQATLDLKSSDKRAGPLPVLRRLIRDCPKDGILCPESRQKSLKEAVVNLCQCLRPLLELSEGSVPQVANLVLCCILPAAIGVPDSAQVFASILKYVPELTQDSCNSTKTFVSSMLSKIENTMSSGMENEGLSRPSHPRTESNINKGTLNENLDLRLNLTNAIMQCPSAAKLVLQTSGLHPEDLLLGILFKVVTDSCVSHVTRHHPSCIKALIFWFVAANQALDVSDTHSTETTFYVHKMIGNCLGKSLTILSYCLWDGKAFGLLLDLADNIRKKCTKEEMEKFSKVHKMFLLKCVMLELPWRNKRKLQMLAELLPRCGEKVVLSQYPDMPEGIAQALPYNELQSACADVYKVLLEALSEADFDEHFTPVHVACLVNKSTISGLSNYWLPVLARKYPNLIKILPSQIPEDNLAARIILMQVQRREGLLNLEAMLKIQENFKLLCDGLVAYDIDTRVRAFQSLCIGCGQGLIEADLLSIALAVVQGFLVDNINIASQAGRHSLVRSFSFFLISVRDFLSHVLQTKSAIAPFNLKKETVPCITFLQWLYQFLIHNLEPAGSYQRHITSLRIYQLVLISFTSESKNTKISALNIRNALESCDAWPFVSGGGARAVLLCVFSPTDDVRAAAANIICDNPDLAVFLPKEDDLLSEALQLCCSPHFFAAESGALLYSIVSECKSISKTELLCSLCVEAQKQFVIMKQSLLKAASEGSPMHGVMRAILVLFQSCKGPDSYPTKETLNVLDLIEAITEHFLALLASSSSTQEYAPSFEDMDWAIESQVYEQYEVSEKSLKLSPQYQLSLNCAWLNLKVCCEIASHFGSEFSSHKGKEALEERCGHVLMSVLQKCRHKGAFEAAGVALSVFVRQTLSNGSKVPQTLLSKVVASLSAKGKDAPPLSRRSAGLAVAVHRIVCSESHPSKTLLHHVMKELLSILKTDENPQESENDHSFVDSPATRAMHVLLTLVSDSSMRQYMAQHLCEVTLASLRYISSVDWGLRNAAMQLYGAVVTKMTSQKQSKRGEERLEEKLEEDWDLSGCGLLEDMLISRPVLFNYLASEIQKTALSLTTDNPLDDYQKYSSTIVFHMCLILRSTPGPRSLRTAYQEAAVQNILSSCWLLLGSPQWIVRNQVALCIVFYTSVSDLPQLAFKADQTINVPSEYQRHGCILLLSKINKKYDFICQNMSTDFKLKNAKPKILTNCRSKIESNCSYICRNPANAINIEIDVLLNLLHELNEKPCTPEYGKTLWLADVLETVLRGNKILPMEVLPKCFDCDRLPYIQKRILKTLLSMLLTNEIQNPEELRYFLCNKFYDYLNTDKEVNIIRRKLLPVQKLLIEYLKRNAKIHSTYLRNMFPNPWSSIATKQKAPVDQSLWVKPLMGVLKKKLFGDKFELLSLEMLSYHIIEIATLGEIVYAVALLRSLVLILQLILELLGPETNELGNVLVILSPITWSLKFISTEFHLETEDIAIALLEITAKLLLEQSESAAKSVWPLSALRKEASLNPAYCLRHLFPLAAVHSLEFIEAYLWEKVKLHPKELESMGMNTEKTISPFNHYYNLVEMEDFQILELAASFRINSSPQREGLWLENITSNVRSIQSKTTVLRSQATGPLQWLPPEAHVAIRKIFFHLWQRRKDISTNDLRKILLDGVQADEMLERFTKLRETQNILDASLN